jgi:hypothetical protein
MGPVAEAVFPETLAIERFCREGKNLSPGLDRFESLPNRRKGKRLKEESASKTGRKIQQVQIGM